MLVGSWKILLISKISNILMAGLWILEYVQVRDDLSLVLQYPWDGGSAEGSLFATESSLIFSRNISVTI